MLKTMSKISVLTMISALFVFAFAGAAFAEEGDEELVVQPVQMEEPDLPVGGWAPAEAIYVPTDIVVNGSDSSDKKRKSGSKNGSSMDPIFTDECAASTGYNALDPGQQELYEAIDNAAKDFMNANEDLEPTDVKEGGEEVERYILDEIDYTQVEIAGDTIEERKQNALKAYYAYDYDHPAYYWLSNLILFNEESLYPCTEKEYASVETRQAINEMVSKGVKGYATLAAEKGTNTLDKIVLVHDQIVNDIDYAYQEDGKTPVEEKWAHGVHGVFDPGIKLAVCEGYADAFALIMNYMDITNYYIVGDAGSGGPGGGEGHAWNAVYDDAAKRYLYMDLTWDDCGEDGYSYAYFGMPMTDFEKSHYEYTAKEYTEEGTLKPAKEWLYDIPGDYNDGFVGTYYNQGGFYYDGSTDVNDLIIAAKEKAVRAGEWVSVLCPDEDSAAEIADALCVEDSYYTVKYENVDYAYLTGKVSTPVYKWSEDYSQATATRIYKNADGDAESEESDPVNTSVVDEMAPTCTEDGTVTYTATFEDETIPAKTKEVTIEALGHDWGTPTYTWASGYGKVTAKRECSRQCEDGCTETETANTTSKVTRKATYTAKGQTTYTAAFKNPAFKASKTVTNIRMLNPMKVKVTTKTVKVKTLKKKALVVTPMKVTYAKGKVTYKVVGGNAKSKKALALNTKTGKITVKKKTKKGKYQIKVKVTAAGTTAYKALSKTVTVTVNAK